MTTVALIFIIDRIHNTTLNLYYLRATAVAQLPLRVYTAFKDRRRAGWSQKAQRCTQYDLQRSSPSFLRS